MDVFSPHSSHHRSHEPFARRARLRVDDHGAREVCVLQRGPCARLTERLALLAEDGGGWMRSFGPGYPVKRDSSSARPTTCVKGRYTTSYAVCSPYSSHQLTSCRPPGRACVSCSARTSPVPAPSRLDSTPSEELRCTIRLRATPACFHIGRQFTTACYPTPRRQTLPDERRERNGDTQARGCKQGCDDERLANCVTRELYDAPADDKCHPTPPKTHSSSSEPPETRK